MTPQLGGRWNALRGRTREGTQLATSSPGSRRARLWRHAALPEAGQHHGGPSADDVLELARSR